MNDNERKTPPVLTQAELFGLDELDRIETDPKTGIGTAKDAPKTDQAKMLGDGKSCAELLAEVERLYADVAAAQTEHAPIGASPLPWHWREGGGGSIDVFDARGAIVFHNVNYDGTDTDRDWLNVELMVACVNRFAALVTPEELTRLRRKQVYGDENRKED